MYNNYYAINTYDDNYLAHHGILGQKWGIRRYQNEDGTLTEAGKRRYQSYDDSNDINDILYAQGERYEPLIPIATSLMLGGLSIPVAINTGKALVPLLLGGLALGGGIGALMSYANKGLYYLEKKFNESSKARFIKKLEEDRKKNGHYSNQKLNEYTNKNRNRRAIAGAAATSAIDINTSNYFNNFDNHYIRDYVMGGYGIGSYGMGM